MVDQYICYSFKFFLPFDLHLLCCSIRLQSSTEPRFFLPCHELRWKTMCWTIGNGYNLQQLAVAYSLNFALSGQKVMGLHGTFIPDSPTKIRVACCSPSILEVHLKDEKSLAIETEVGLRNFAGPVPLRRRRACEQCGECLHKCPNVPNGSLRSGCRECCVLGDYPSSFRPIFNGIIFGSVKVGIKFNTVKSNFSRSSHIQTFSISLPSAFTCHGSVLLPNS